MGGKCKDLEKRRLWLLEYRKKNRDILLAKRRVYKEKNKERIAVKNKEYYEANKEKLSIKGKEYRATHHDKRPKEKSREAAMKWYYKHGQGRSRNQHAQELHLQWNEKYPERVKAHALVAQDIKMKRIIPPDVCSKCGAKKRLNAHHYNYNHYLNFIWLCASCHKLLHLENNLKKTKKKLDI